MKLFLTRADAKLGKVMNVPEGQIRIEKVLGELACFPGGRGVFGVVASWVGIGKPMTPLDLANLRLALLIVR